MEDLTMMSMAQVAKMIETKEISPVEITEASLKRTEKLQDELNPFITIMADEARSQAKQAESEIAKGNYRGSLHGIPVSVKDLYYTKGIPTTGGSALLADFRPDYNSTVVQRLLDAGAILTGKANTHEFAFGPTNEDSHFGPARNPWNPKKIPGGSSGGSGVTVATGMSYVSMGTDTGGSVRIPASMCGVVGFKPTYGLISLYGVIPLSFTLDHAGPLTRSVLDTAITMDYITGFDPLDANAQRSVNGPTHFEQDLKHVQDLKGKVIGVPENFFFDKTDYEIEKIVLQAIDNLKTLGAEIRPITIPALDLVQEASTAIMFAEAGYAHREHFVSQADKYFPGVRERIQQGRDYAAIDYIKALKDREIIKAEWEKALAELDAIVAPTIPVAPYDIGLPAPWNIETRGQTEPGRPMVTYHTRLACMTGAPSLSVPCGIDSNGLPVGLMFMGKHNDDLAMLQQGYAYEKAFPFLQLDSKNT